MPDVLESARWKLERADAHLRDLERLIGAFHEANVHSIVREDDPQAGKRRLVYRGPAPTVSAQIRLSIGDVAHNLRSALDHFAYAAVPTGVMDVHKIAFPIWRRSSPPTAREWRNAVERSMRGVSVPLRTALSQMEPYRGGQSEPLWALDRLDILDKHRTVLASGLGHQLAVDFDFAKAFPDVEWLESMSLPVVLNLAKPEILSDGQVLLESSLDEPDYDAQVMLFVAVDEPITLRGKDVVPALRALGDEVKGLLERLAPLV